MLLERENGWQPDPKHDYHWFVSFISLRLKPFPSVFRASQAAGPTSLSLIAKNEKTVRFMIV